MTDAELWETFAWMLWPAVFAGICLIFWLGCQVDEYRYRREVRRWRRREKRD